MIHSARAAFKLDFSNFERGFALRCSIGVAIPLFVSLIVHQPQYGISAALGALSTGFASQQGVYRTRAAAMLCTAFGMALSTLVGGFAAHATIAMIVTVALWGYLYGLLSSLGPAASAVGLNSVVALVIADAFAGNNASIVPMQALLVLAGGIEQTLLLVVLWPTRRYSAERHVLGDAYRALGAYANLLCEGAPGAPHPQAIASVREILSDPAPFSRRGDIAAFQTLLDEAERVRASLAGLMTDRYRYERRDDPQKVRAIGEFGEAVAPLLEEIAEALHEARAPKTIGYEWKRAESAAAALDPLPGAIGKHARSQAQALLGQMRSAWKNASMPAHGNLAPEPTRPQPRPFFPSLQETWLTLRANLGLDSPFGRHAARMAVTLGIAMAVARLGPLQRGYWVPMTALLVLRPDFRTTFTRGVARIVGTLLGAVLATVIVTELHPSQNLDADLAILFAALGYFVFGLNYAVYTATVTAYVVFLLALIGTPEHDAVVTRALATLVGAALAALAYLAWPTWESGRMRVLLAEQLDAYRKYISALLDAYVDPASRNPKRLRELQSRAWQERAHAEASVDAMLAEPKQTHVLPTNVALGVLAATQRLGLAQLALNGYIETAAPIARPMLAPLRDGVDGALRACAEILRSGKSLGSMPALRDLYRAAEDQLNEAADPDAGVILSECDILVDAVNTLAELLKPPERKRRSA